MFELLSEVNYLAVTVAALAYFAFGALWYAPPVLGRRWQAAVGMTEPGNPSPMLFVGTFIAYFVMATALAMLARGLGLETVGDGLELGLVIAIGIVAMGLWVGTMYERRPAALMWINIGNAIIGLLIMSAIVTIWD